MVFLFGFRIHLTLDPLRKYISLYHSFVVDDIEDQGVAKERGEKEKSYHNWRKACATPILIGHTLKCIWCISDRCEVCTPGRPGRLGCRGANNNLGTTVQFTPLVLYRYVHNSLFLPFDCLVRTWRCPLISILSSPHFYPSWHDNNIIHSHLCRQILCLMWPGLLLKFICTDIT